MDSEIGKSTAEIAKDAKKRNSAFIFIKDDAGNHIVIGKHWIFTEKPRMNADKRRFIATLSEK